MRQADTDNDLVKVADTVTEAGGEIIVLKGQILSSDSHPLANNRIEIWQCDVNSRSRQANWWMEAKPICGY